MYHIFIPTPLYRNSKQLAHLLEHCTGSALLQQYENYIYYESSIEAITTNRYIRYTLPNTSLLTQYRKALTTLIPEFIYTKEKNRIKDEMQSSTL